MVIMDENIRFIQVLDNLKEKGIIEDYVQAANSLNTNKAAISDLKSGRKKLSIDILRRMKISYPSISIEWIVMGTGDMFNETNKNAHESISDNQSTYFIEKIAQQAEEIGVLKERIKQLERSKDESALDVQGSTHANAG